MRQICYFRKDENNFIKFFFRPVDIAAFIYFRIFNVLIVNYII